MNIRNKVFILRLLNILLAFSVLLVIMQSPGPAVDRKIKSMSSSLRKYLIFSANYDSIIFPRFNILFNNFVNILPLPIVA